MTGGATWEDLHDQIGSMLPLMDAEPAAAVSAALAEGRQVRYEHEPVSAPLLQALQDLDGTLAALTVNTASYYIVVATRDLLLGLLPVAALPSHLASAWLALEAARPLLAQAPAAPVGPKPIPFAVPTRPPPPAAPQCNEATERAIA